MVLGAANAQADVAGPEETCPDGSNPVPCTWDALACEPERCQSDADCGRDERCDVANLCMWDRDCDGQMVESVGRYCSASDPDSCLGGTCEIDVLVCLDAEDDEDSSCALRGPRSQDGPPSLRWVATVCALWLVRRPRRRS
jgi:hypothetical protein